MQRVLKILPAALLFSILSAPTSLITIPQRTVTAAVNTQTIPAPPSARADRFGAYNWAIDYGAYPGDAGGNDRLNWGAEQVAALGSSVIRVWLGARNIYYLAGESNPPAASFDLVTEASRPAYDKLFRDPRFKTCLLTTYSYADMTGNWGDGYTDAEYQAERDEIRRLGEYLLGNPDYAGKTFIILNWEGDNMMFRQYNKQSAWDNLVRWVQSRADGVIAARQNLPASASQLYSAFEYNRVRSPEGQPCGTPVSDPAHNPLKHRCAVDYVAPRVNVDYYSYSGYQSYYAKVVNPALNAKEEFNRDLNFALNLIKAQRPDITQHNFMIGEIGYPRTDFGECYAAETLRETLEVFTAPDSFQVSYVLLWQIVDNGPTWDSDEWPGFGLFRVRNGQLEQTMNGKVAQAFLTSQSFTLPDDCPRVRRSPEPGILDAQSGTTDFHLNPDSVMAIYAQGCCVNPANPFSASGNIVRFRQGNREYLLPRDNADFFYESPSQVNASLPATRHPGKALVYLTDARGIDSTAQYLDLRCDDCPLLRAEQDYGVVAAINRMDDYQPDKPIAISGERFSARGNTVYVDQIDNAQVWHRYTLARDDAWTESDVLITARLPAELIVDRPAWLHVVNADGYRSNIYRLLTNGACQNCRPGLRPVQAVINSVSRQEEFHPGTVIEIRGASFSAAGNQVIVAQGGNRFVLSRDNRWSESPAFITAALPASLQPGHAIVYVIDATGRETIAADLMITTTMVATVSAASYAPSMAAEAIAAAFGTGLATATSSASATPLPDMLAGTSVIVKDSTGTERTAPLFFVSPAQVNYQVPAGTAPGTATVTITSGDGSVSTGTAAITTVAPGLFSANASGSGLAAAFAVRVKPDNSQTLEPIAEFDPATNQFKAVPLDLGPATDQVYLALFGTGIRYRSAAANVKVSGGGAEMSVTYAGAQLQLVGLDQINVLLPRTLIGRGLLDLAAVVDGQTTNSVKINIK